MTKVIEAVRQLRGEAHPKVQVKNCDLALAHGTGGSLGTRHGSATADPGGGSEPWPTAAPNDPGPDRNPETKPFWEAAAKGKLLVKTLHGLRRSAHHYPRAICPFCGSDRTEWKDCRRAAARSTPTA